MLIHLTGMSPRTASQRTREHLTFAGLLERALTVEGHKVDRRPYLDTEPDLVIVGVTSMISPGATYALAGLEAIGHAIDCSLPLMLFVDDPMLPKTKAAAKSVLREPERLWTEYLLSKRIRQSRDPDSKQKWHIRAGIELLAQEQWPVVLVPMHTWGVIDRMNAVLLPKRLGIVSDVVALDVTAVLGLDLTPSSPRKPQANIWVTDSHYSKAVLPHGRASWPVVPINSTAMPDPADVYATARGVHQGLVGGCPGWWTPTPLYAAKANAAYLMDQDEQNLTGTDSPYYVTADDIEAMNSPGHELLVERQRAYLKDTAWSLESLLSTLEDVIGSTGSFELQAMRGPTSGTS
jgi:hypothetical protein